MKHGIKRRYSRAKGGIENGEAEKYMPANRSSKEVKRREPAQARTIVGRYAMFAVGGRVGSTSGPDPNVRCRW